LGDTEEYRIDNVIFELWQAVALVETPGDVRKFDTVETCSRFADTYTA
jgi:hypothetical protein